MAKKTTKKTTNKKTVVSSGDKDTAVTEVKEEQGYKRGENPDFKDKSVGFEVRKRNSELKKTIQDILPNSKIDDLQREVLENWVELLSSEDMRVWAVATKELSKYIFPQKREHQVVPNIDIQCNFIGILADDMALINDKTNTETLEKIKRDLMAQVTQIDILLHNRKGKKDGTIS